MTSSFWGSLYTVSAPSHHGVQRPTQHDLVIHDQDPQAGSSMILTYRGRRYRSSTYLMEGIELQVDTTYRGVRHRLQAFFATSKGAELIKPAAGDRPQLTLAYRGIPYVR